MTVTPETNCASQIDPEDQTAIASHDWETDESLSETIVSTVATLSGTEPDELDRLYDRVDPDSLETLFAPTGGTARRNAGRVSFRLAEYTVTVHASGTIVVTAAD
ncbi:HalOD1 output domain-containing protein [Natrarchaeobaculum aegyptiacum]|uniref:Halobacterial output domain-containing protein n=1 Tax=Natrarchaeobaculum aegyptiacum TaxID=745377 RepID=A0A2Z2HWH6_9EURY|nr:HalOD1 output domain-containing protein [Natrarchaeobaculum aegyptiacum]ARS91709.1 hypothetical protein B1756_06120 [Natrarchaeobaculum aegyptiacum]